MIVKRVMARVGWQLCWLKQLSRWSERRPVKAGLRQVMLPARYKPLSGS